MHFQPVLDTWQNWSHAGIWRFAQSLPMENRSTAEYFGQLFKENVTEHLRPGKVMLDGCAEVDPVFSSAFTANEPEELLTRLRAAPAPVSSVCLELKLKVWFRTGVDTEPMLEWLERLAILDLSVDPNGYVALMVHHTLFSPGVYGDNSNLTLAALNAPVLANLLAVIAANAGELEEIEGLPGITPTGWMIPR